MKSIPSERAPWLQELISVGYRMGIPMGALRSRRRPLGPINGVASVGSAVQFQLCTGETFVVDLDEENADYIRGRLAVDYDSAGFIWFETTDGCLRGINLAHVDAVNWKSQGTKTADPLSWRHDCVSMRFSDGAAMELPKTVGETIEYLKGATLRMHRKPFHLVRYADGRTVSVNLQNLVWVTMPAAWLDEDP
jgi:hypothetical protein